VAGSEEKIGNGGEGNREKSLKKDLQASIKTLFVVAINKKGWRRLEGGHIDKGGKEKGVT